MGKAEEAFEDGIGNITPAEAEANFYGSQDVEPMEGQLIETSLQKIRPVAVWSLDDVSHEP